TGRARGRWYTSATLATLAGPYLLTRPSRTPKSARVIHHFKLIVLFILYIAVLLETPKNARLDMGGAQPAQPAKAPLVSTAFVSIGTGFVDFAPLSHRCGSGAKGC